MRNCLFCKKSFQEVGNLKKFCSRRCGHENRKGGLISLSSKLNICCGTTGALGELMVCCDLLKMGYQVFRSVSPHSNFDIVISKDSKFLKIEVTTGGIYKPTGRIYNPVKDTSKFDILAVVIHPDKILYFPEGII